MHHVTLCAAGLSKPHLSLSLVHSFTPPHPPSFLFLWSVFAVSLYGFPHPYPLWSFKVLPPSPSLQPPCPSLAFSLCLERKRWPLNMSAGVWGSGEQPSHCVTPPWTPDGLMNKGSPPPLPATTTTSFSTPTAFSRHTRPLVGNSPTSFTGSQTSPAAFD